MWNAAENKIPEYQIREEHLRVLEQAVQDAGEDDVRTSAVYEALDYLQNGCTRSWGFTLFREGLEYNMPLALRQGLEQIRKHLGK